MSEEKKGKKFEKIVKALHKKTKLPSLRTYQGDMAEFIKNKDESVASIAIKEKEAQRKKEEEKQKKEDKKEGKEVKEIKSISKPSGKGFQMNIIALSLSIVLIAAGSFAIFYVAKFLMNREPVKNVELGTDIIPYNSVVEVINVSNKNLGSELIRLSLADGIHLVKISSNLLPSLKGAEQFFDFLEIELPADLDRTLQEKYALGVISQNGENFPFLVIIVDDFGAAFSAMLEWEEEMLENLSFLDVTQVNTADTQATSTKNTATEEVFSWKDIIIKNKDTRGLVSSSGKVKIIYTFLNKDTIFITNSVYAVGNMSSAYVSRRVVR